MESDSRFDNPHQREVMDQLEQLRAHVDLLERRDEINLQIISSLVIENRALRDQLNGRLAKDNLNLLSYLYEVKQ